MSTFSIIADIATVLAFSITIWQLLSLKKMIKSREEEAKKQQLKSIYLASVSEALELIDIIQNYLISCDDRLALLRMEDLNKILLEIRDEQEVKQHARENFPKLLNDFVQRMISLREAVSSKEAYDSRFLKENLQYIHDNLKLVQKYLKK